MDTDSSSNGRTEQENEPGLFAAWLDYILCVYIIQKIDNCLLDNI